MNGGKLVPDEIIVGMMGERLKEKDCERVFSLMDFREPSPRQKL